MLWVNGGVGGNGQTVNRIGLLELLVFLNEAFSLKDPAVKLGYFFLDNKLSISVPVNHTLHRLPIQNMRADHMHAVSAPPSPAQLRAHMQH
jgi:hypothetical protein